MRLRWRHTKGGWMVTAVENSRVFGRIEYIIPWIVNTEKISMLVIDIYHRKTLAAYCAGWQGSEGEEHESGVGADGIE